MDTVTARARRCVGRRTFEARTETTLGESAVEAPPPVRRRLLSFGRKRTPTPSPTTSTFEIPRRRSAPLVFSRRLVYLTRLVSTSPVRTPAPLPVISRTPSPARRASPPIVVSEPVEESRAVVYPRRPAVETTPESNLPPGEFIARAVLKPVVASPPVRPPSVRLSRSFDDFSRPPREAPPVFVNGADRPPREAPPALMAKQTSMAPEMAAFHARARADLHSPPRPVQRRASTPVDDEDDVPLAVIKRRSQLPRSASHASLVSPPAPAMARSRSSPAETTQRRVSTAPVGPPLPRSHTTPRLDRRALAVPPLPRSSTVPADIAARRQSSMAKLVGAAPPISNGVPPLRRLHAPPPRLPDSPVRHVSAAVLKAERTAVARGSHLFLGPSARSLSTSSLARP